MLPLTRPNLLLPKGGLSALSLLAYLLASCPQPVVGGGSGLNVAVVINQNSSNSVALGNYYCEKRQVPPENVLRISWTGGNTSWSLNQFQTSLLSPLLVMLESRGLTNQISFAVLSMDIPFSVTNDYAVNSTTAALFYGFKGDLYAPPDDSINSYAASESPFSFNQPVTSRGYSFLSTLLTAGSLAQAKKLVDQGVASDGSFPTQTVVLAKSSDYLRNIRYHAFDNAIFNSRLGGVCSIQKTNSDSPNGQTNVLGYQTGLSSFSVSQNAFVPGAMADSMTSFGGIIFGPNGQTTLLTFIHAGAAGSYGTVTEPQPAPEKFPDPQNYFFQARGFSLAESYYQSLTNPFQGLIVGEPLAAPFRKLMTASWVGVETNAIFSGKTNLTLQFASHDAARPMQRVDLFVDGKFSRALTNLTPQPGNELSVSLNSYRINYVVPTNATLSVVVTGLVEALNYPDVTNITGVCAAAHGDRIELQSLLPQLGPKAYEFVHEDPNTNAVWQYFAVRQLPSASGNLSAKGFNSAGGFDLSADAPPGLAYSIQASTNLKDWLPIYVNPGGGPLNFTDPYARFYQRRFYRIAPSWNTPRAPRLVPLNKSADGFRAYMEVAAGLQYVIEASTNLNTWISIATNFLGGPTEFVDPDAMRYPKRFYRVGVLGKSGRPYLRPLGRDAGGRFELTVESADSAPYVIEASSDFVQWTDITTNSVGGTLDLIDLDSANLARRFYRARILDPQLEPTVAVIGRTPIGENILRVTENVSEATVVLASTNSVDWLPVYTNGNNSGITTTVRSSIGTAERFTTSISAARGSFLDSIANGVRQININGSVQVGTYLRMTVTKTNGSQITLAVTNQVSGGSLFQLLQQLTNQVNFAVNLQGEDGLVAEDLSQGFLGVSTFNLRARSAGYAAAGIRVSLFSQNPVVSGLLDSVDLRGNLDDLRPRNHLYLAAGVTNLSLLFTLDSTTLPDGYHELTAVAYEGTHVQTQTRSVLPIRIQNTALNATLEITDAADDVPVSNTFHIRVTATGNGISDISLFSTGGWLGSINNQNSGTFAVSGNLLGAGLHPFFAVITAANGSKYRTETTRVRLIP